MSAGTRVGPYQLERLLGEGGFSAVWLGARAPGADETLPERAAIKLSPDRERLQRECRLLRRLEAIEATPRVVLDPDELGGPRPAAVLGYRPGSPLTERVAQGPTPPERCLQLMRGLLGLLQLVHEAGVIHRDLKPANVLEREDGGLELIDFGLAAAPEQGEAASAAQRQAAVSLHSQSTSGTPSYMSPEQRAGDTPTPADDLYAAGVMLFELATGRQPALNELPPGDSPADRRLRGLYQALAAPLAERVASAEAALSLIAEGDDEPEDDLHPFGCALALAGLLLIALSIALLIRGVPSARIGLVLGGLMLLGLRWRTAA